MVLLAMLQQGNRAYAIEVRREREAGARACTLGRTPGHESVVPPVAVDHLWIDLHQASGLRRNAIGIGRPRPPGAFVEGLPEDAVLVYVRPRVLSLMTGRRAAANHEPDSDREFRRFLTEIEATHLVLGPQTLGRREYLEEFLSRNPLSHRSIFANAQFEVFEAVP